MKYLELAHPVTHGRHLVSFLGLKLPLSLFLGFLLGLQTATTQESELIFDIERRMFDLRSLKATSSTHEISLVKLVLWAGRSSAGGIQCLFLLNERVPARK